MRRAAVAALVVALTSCGSDAVVLDEARSSGTTPYSGPLDGDVSHADDADVATRSGPAAGALECDGEPDNGGGADYDSGLASTQGDPEGALADWFDEDGGWYAGLPDRGYRVEAARDGRVLFSYDVDGRTKAAVIVADDITDWEGETGWGVAAWSMCNAAELPEELTEEMGIGVWTDAAGDRVPTSTVRSGRGAEHCDWEDITFLSLGSPPQEQQFLSADAGGDLAEQLSGPPDDHAALPRDATDTGFQRDGRRLWLASDRSAAYLVDLADDADVWRWPRAKEPIYCA